MRRIGREATRFAAALAISATSSLIVPGCGGGGGHGGGGGLPLTTQTPTSGPLEMGPTPS